MSTRFLLRSCPALQCLALILLLTSLSWSATERLLYQFRIYLHGAYPSPQLISDPTGNLYGTTSGGGAYGYGTVFELKSLPGNKWREQILYDFRGYPEGSGPEAGVTFGPEGDLYGTTYGGGAANYGTVFHLTRNSDGKWKESILYTFSNKTDGGFPNSPLVLDTSGTLYGTTEYGAASGSGGAVFQLSNSGGHWTEQLLHSFCSLPGCADGLYPNAVTVAPDGTIYGTTSWDGPDSEGAAFELRSHHDGWKLTVIHGFGHPGDGGSPRGALLLDDSGNLYGTTTVGGTGNENCYAVGCGTVFELSPSRSGEWTETILYKFNGGDDGVNPYGGLIFDANRNLYGTTQHGGGGKCRRAPVDGCGTVFELSPGSSGWTESVLYSFEHNRMGTRPVSTLLLDSSGKLYGTTEGGIIHDAAVVFQLTKVSGTWREQVLEGFRSGGGSEPNDPPILVGSNRMFGTTSHDGVYGYGTVFEVQTGANGEWRETVLHNFNGKDGHWPRGRLLRDRDGNLFGTTSNGGGNRCGVVFELSPDAKGTWGEKVLHSFSNSDGCWPFAGLVADSSGNLYGTTYYGGANGPGTVFELSSNSNGTWSEQILYSFTGGNDGGNPSGTLLFDSAGNLYGTTFYGGGGGCDDGYNTGCGTVFELTPSSGNWTLTTLYDFSATGDGNNPAAGVAFDQGGNLYGTTENGGVDYFGTAFELSPDGQGGWSETKLYSFAGESDGALPDCVLLVDARNNVYGTAQGYRASAGTVFELSPASGGGWTEKTLHLFDARDDGAGPTGGVVRNAAGNLIGATSGGGSVGAGTVFEVTP